MTLVIVALLHPGAAASRGASEVDRALANAELLRRDALRAREAAVDVGVPVPRLSEQRKRLKLAPGDLLTASTVKNKILQVRADNGRVVNGKIKGPGLEPRGVDYDAVSGLMAIAAVDRVVLWDPEEGEATDLQGPDGEPFEFAADVLFDQAGGLIIADQGEPQGTDDRGALHPDGGVWRYDLESGALTQIATGKALVNPKLLALDKKGVIHFIDGGAGPLVSPVTDIRWDVIYRVEGKNLTRVKPVWNEAGVQATAYAISDSGWHWIVNLGALVRIKGKKIEQPCLPPYPMQFATGLLLNPDDTATVMDGADVVSRERSLLSLNAECVATGRADRKLKGARGLTRVPE